MKKTEAVFVSEKDCVKKLEKLSAYEAKKNDDNMKIYFLATERVFATTNYSTMIYCDVSLFSPGKDLPAGAYSFLSTDGTPVKTGEIPERRTHQWGKYLEKGVLDDMGTHNTYDRSIVLSKANLEKGIDIQEMVLKTGKMISMKELSYIPEGEYRVKTPVGDEVTYIFASTEYSPEDDSRPLVVAAVCCYR